MPPFDLLNKTTGAAFPFFFLIRQKTKKKSNNFPKRIEVPKRKKYKNGVCREKNQAINIGGISYNSITKASKYLNMSFGKLNYKIKNNKIDFIWLKK